MLLLSRRRVLHAVSLLALFATTLGLGAAPSDSSRNRIPVIFHTDIGTDIDDTWALAYLLRHPDLDLKLVLTDTGDTHYRAKLAARLLEIAGRADVPIGLGTATSTKDQPLNQEPWIADYDLAKYAGGVSEDGVALLLETIRRSPVPVTIVSVSAVPALAAAVTKEPSIAARARFVGMHGSFDIGYGDKPPAAAEWNVKVDPTALRTVLAAPWRDVLLTPLDTCGNVSLGGADYRAIWCAMDDPLLRAVIENYCLFAGRVTWMKCDFFTQRSTTLFDCVAVYLAADEGLVETETVRFRVNADGMTVRDPAGVPARVALRWKDRAAYESHLATILRSHEASAPSAGSPPGR